MEVEAAPASASDPPSPSNDPSPSPALSARGGRRKGKAENVIAEDEKEEMTPKKRGRKIATSTSLPSSTVPVCVLLTGYQRDARIEKLVRDIGGEITNDPSPQVTHCITTPELKRTPKLLMSINYGAYVITLDWLEDSAKLGRPLPLLLGTSGDENKKYIVHDQSKERQWNFHLYSTLQQSRSHVSTIFSQLTIYITKGVCGNNAPKADEMKNIVLSGGGIWSTKLPGKKSQASDSAKPIVISSGDVANKEITSSVMDYARTGPGKGIYSIEFLFLAILRFQVDYETGILEGYRF